jgi:hypothetical protein
MDQEAEKAEAAEKHRKTIAMIDETITKIDRITAEITTVEIHLGLPRSNHDDPLEQRLKRLRSFLANQQSTPETPSEENK